MRSPVQTRGRYAAVLGVPAGILISTLMVYQTSDAAFSAKTSNGPGTWAAGGLALQIGADAAQNISVSQMLPATSTSTCVNVQYEGNVAATVRVYGSGLSGTLAQYLTLKVEEGTGATSAACAGFSATNTIFPVPAEASTLKDFMTNRNDFATGAGAWTNATLHAKRSYRFTFTVADDNAAQGLTATGTIKWEAQSQ